MNIVIRKHPVWLGVAFAVAWVLLAFSPRLIDDGISVYRGEEGRVAEHFASSFWRGDIHIMGGVVQKLKVEDVRPLAAPEGDGGQPNHYELRYRLYTFFWVTHSVWSAELSVDPRGEMEWFGLRAIERPPTLPWVGRFCLTALAPWAAFALLAIMMKRRDQ